MSGNPVNIQSYGDANQAIRTSQIGVTMPTSPYPTNMPAGWFDVGIIDNDSGLTQDVTFQTTKKIGWAGGGLVSELRSQFERPFHFTCLEENAVVMGLINPGQLITAVAGTSEVQSVTFAGTGTAGDWAFGLDGIGVVPGLAYNITPSALGTALSAAFGFTVTVTGTVGAYVLTFAASQGDLPQGFAINNMTGVTSITVATTTPGTPTIYSQGVGTTAQRNLRQFSIDLINGRISHRFVVAQGEVQLADSIAYKSGEDTMYKCVMNPFLVNGRFYTDIHNNPALAPGLYF